MENLLQYEENEEYETDSVFAKSMDGSIDKTEDGELSDDELGNNIEVDSNKPNCDDGKENEIQEASMKNDVENNNNVVENEIGIMNENGVGESLIPDFGNDTDVVETAPGVGVGAELIHDIKVDVSDEDDMDTSILGHASDKLVDNIEEDFKKYAWDLLQNATKIVKTHKKGFYDNNRKREDKRREMNLALAKAKKATWLAKGKLIGKETNIVELNQIEKLYIEAYSLEQINKEKHGQINRAEAHEWANMEMNVKRTWADFGMQIMDKMNEIEKMKVDMAK